MKKLLVFLAVLVAGAVIALTVWANGWDWTATERANSVEVTFTVGSGVIAFDRLNCVSLDAQTLRCRVFVEVLSVPFEGE